MAMGVGGERSDSVIMPTTTPRKGFFVSRFYSLIFRERRRKGEREGEKHPCDRETLPIAAPISDLPHNPGLCPDIESKCRLDTQPTEHCRKG